MMKVGTYFPGRGTIVEESYLEGKAAGEAAGKAEGKAEERAALILRVLKQRGVSVPDHVRDRVTSCADLDLLGQWLDRAFTVGGAGELFGDRQATADVEGSVSDGGSNP